MSKRHEKHFERRGMFLWALALVGGLFVIALYARFVLPSDQMAAVITSALVNLTNEDREEESLGTLTVNPLLVAAAQAKANDMAEKGYFAHNSPGGETSWHWFRKAGYSFSYAGENLAVNFTDSVDVERAWMNSPSHRANILNGRFTEIGIATAVGEYQGKKTVFVVQMFGTPAGGTQSPVVTEVVPEEPTEPAVARVEEEEEPNVLGSEAEKVAEKVAAIAVPEGEEVLMPEETVEEPVPNIVPAAETLATSPKTLLRTLYFLAAAVILTILVFMTRLELRRHHTRHVFAACLLLILMGGLFVVADNLLFPTPVIGQELER